MTARRPTLGLLDLTPSPDSAYKRADELWFKLHVRRSFRIRPLMAEEPYLDPSATHVVVRQLQPGLREKLFFSSSRGAAAVDRLPDTDEFCETLWQALEVEDQPFCFADIIALAASRACQSSKVEQ